MAKKFSGSSILKVALFATGLSGIVAEYVLSTLATYFLGNSNFQWTIVLSLMLFSMGVGSRITRSFEHHIAGTFIKIEFLLSILVATSAILVHFLSIQTNSLGIFIYLYCMLIGALIGMEIPLAIRINDQYEQLAVNVSGVMENDYFGSLIGGLFFAFIGLPILGVEFTPIILGVVNASVALICVIAFKDIIRIQNYTKYLFSAIGILVIIFGIGWITKPVLQYAEQGKYQDVVIYSKQSKFQKLVITKWREDIWLYINGNQQLSSFDEALYHEPLVHIPIAHLKGQVSNVLVLGGGDGCAVRELLKYPGIEAITLVDLDPEMTEIARNQKDLLQLNDSALWDPKVTIINDDAWTYMQEQKDFYDFILVDLPDPRNIELNRLYSKEFYSLCYMALRNQGAIITQSGSPYYAPKAFWSIVKSMEGVEKFTQVIPLHNQIPTMGEWGFTLGLKGVERNTDTTGVAKFLSTKKLNWLNASAFEQVHQFGKISFWCDTSEVELNTIQRPITYQYYLSGRWGIY